MGKNESQPKKGNNNNTRKDNFYQQDVSPSKKKVTITSTTVNTVHKQKPKNIETGLASINVDDLIDTMESYKATFVNSHLLWLRRVSEF